ncbi:hypothetical protein F4694_000785 [Bacillus niacini]|uniref:Uncharacterized protein n=1 Tax=Neobacillus niacini TaxID=86668 RepID=A0A852T780_9BACI|nr:hypothetical protein [Neobacillus niacini]
MIPFLRKNQSVRQNSWLFCMETSPASHLLTTNSWLFPSVTSVENRMVLLRSDMIIPPWVYYYYCTLPSGKKMTVILNVS